MVEVSEVVDTIEEDTPEFFKEKGNVFFKEGKWDDAIDAYSSAVCFIQKNDYESAMEDCHAAIEADPGYPKAYLRRSKAYEKQNNFHEALSDLRKAKEIDSKLVPNSEITRLEKQSQEQFKKEKTEVVDKLKGMGNFLLGKFGMSLDNFKLEQTPEGSYSIQFQQNPEKKSEDGK